MTAALAELHRAGCIADTLRFHRYPRSVLIGRHQVLAQAVDLEHCEAWKVECARRITGGGAVYMEPDAFAFDIVIARNTLRLPPSETGDRLCEAIARALSRLRIDARHRPQNEIVADGRKLGGFSGYADGDTLIYQGTILIDTRLDDMSRLLRLPDLTAHLVNLADLLKRVPETAEIEGPMIDELSALFRAIPQTATLSPEELDLADRLHRDQYGLDSFVRETDHESQKPEG